MPSKDKPAEEVLSELFLLISSLYSTIEKIMEAPINQEEATMFFLIICEIITYEKELKKNMNVLSRAFPYVMSLPKGVEMYQRELKLI